MSITRFCTLPVRAFFALALLFVGTFATSSMIVPSQAEAGAVKKAYIAYKGYKFYKKLTRAEQKWEATANAAKRAAKAAKLAKRNFDAELINPTPKKLGFDILKKGDVRKIKDKIISRTATRDEYKQLRSNERFAKRRQNGVEEFWEEESERLANGKPGTRNWTEKMRRDILDERTPTFNGKPIEGHHKYSAHEYPHLADNPRNIYPVTRKEHLYQQHGGRFRNQTRGTPLNPSYPSEF